MTRYHLLQRAELSSSNKDFVLKSWDNSLDCFLEQILLLKLADDEQDVEEIKEILFSLEDDISKLYEILSHLLKLDVRRSFIDKEYSLILKIYKLLKSYNFGDRVYLQNLVEAVSEFRRFRKRLNGRLGGDSRKTFTN